MRCSINPCPGTEWGNTERLINIGSEGGSAIEKRYTFSFLLNESMEGHAHISFGRAFQIVAASKAKLKPNCFADL